MYIGDTMPSLITNHALGSYDPRATRFCSVCFSFNLHGKLCQLLGIDEAHLMISEPSWLDALSMGIPCILWLLRRSRLRAYGVLHVRRKLRGCYQVWNTSTRLPPLTETNARLPSVAIPRGSQSPWAIVSMRPSSQSWRTLPTRVSEWYVVMSAMS